MIEMSDNQTTSNDIIDKSKTHVAEVLTYLGYGALTTIVVVGKLSVLFLTKDVSGIDVNDLTTAWVGATTSLITWVIAKTKFNGNGNTS